jgi:hypothetical protein
MRAADGALYQSKRNGRDRVELAVTVDQFSDPRLHTT